MLPHTEKETKANIVGSEVVSVNEDMVLNY